MQIFSSHFDSFEYISGLSYSKFGAWCDHPEEKVCIFLCQLTLCRHSAAMASA